MTRSRAEIVADIERLFVELDAADHPEDRGDGWLLDHWTAVAAWTRYNHENGEVNTMTSLVVRAFPEPEWKVRGLLHEGLSYMD